MSRRRYLTATALAAIGFTGLFTAVALHAPRPRLLWNATESAPIGLYRIRATRMPSVGALVAVLPPPHLARFMAERRYLPLGVPLLKHVAARPGAWLCRHGGRVTVDGRLVAIARLRDRSGRALPVWRGCQRLGAHALFLLNSAPDSLDGRYLGPLPDAGLLGRATPILTRDAPGQPFRWHGLGVPQPPPPDDEETTNGHR